MTGAAVEAVPLVRDGLPETAEAWLQQLQDLALLRVAGRDSGRLRVVSCLLHGNEPSGLRAVYRLLRGPVQPATDLLILVGAVRAALGPPAYGKRFWGEGPDYNRIWLPPHDGPAAGRAALLASTIAASGAEAVLDLHNNTGHNPPYGVGPDAAELNLGIVSLFGERFVHSELRMGTLMEALAPHLPCVTIECGRAGDPAADEVAHEGLSAFVQAPDLQALRADAARVSVLGNPVRVQLIPGATLAFGHTPEPGADLTLDPDLDRHNFQLLSEGEVLGWLSGEVLPLRAVAEDGADLASVLFRRDGPRLRAAAAFMPVMMTTSPEAALADCLFYAVQPRPR